MSDLIFGIILLTLSLPTALAFLITVPPNMIPFVIIFFLPVNYIGYRILKKGKKTIEKDKETERKGEICYGRIKDAYPTGVVINDTKEYKVIIYFYIPSLKKEEKLEEIIGTEYYEYHKGEYVKLKYYNGDINILSKVDRKEVPQNILDLYENVAELKSDIILYSNEKLEPMNMPANGSVYAWEKKENETIK